MKYIFTILVLAPMLLFAQEGTTVVIDASDYSNWVYFSFDADGVIEVSDPQSSSEWDIAFLRYNIRTNSGASGSGEGGAFDAGEVSFTSVTQAPEGDYLADDSIGVYDPMNHVYVNTPGNTLLAEWLQLDLSTIPPIATYSNHVYILKTGDGKYAKVMLTDYYNDDAESGHLKFTYFYQPSGSRNFTGVTAIGDDGEIPNQFALNANYPNPFNPSTTISYSLASSADVTVSIYNIVGSLVDEFEMGQQGTGTHQIVWTGKNHNGERVSSGIYIYTLTALPQSGEAFVKSKKMTLLK